ncbi:MAG: Re/Si-specific NAD(P)(+) transhydrogenase subunit alpha, partial [Pseudomonadota bacterium]
PQAMKIGVPKERRSAELRLAASPDTVTRLVAEGIEVLVEKGAGTGALFSDDGFAAVGAQIVDQPEALYDACDVVLKVRRPLQAGEDKVDEMAWLKQGQVLIGLLDPMQNRDQVEACAKAGVTAFAMEMLPRSTRAQAMDVLSSQANLAGYRAVLDGLAAYSGVMPMMMTAAGTVPPAKVFVIGAGVAGLQAIATARRLGAVVSATDVRPAAKEEVESLGAKFVGAPVEDAATQGGYAKELAEAQQEKQRELLAETLKSQDLVITTAQIPGRTAPVIVTSAMVDGMKPGAVLVDMAVESGGNCELSKLGKTVRRKGVTILGPANLPSELAPACSSLYARNLYNFVQLLIDKETKALVIDQDDDLIQGTMITNDGKVVHPRLTDVGSS